MRDLKAIGLDDWYMLYVKIERDGLACVQWLLMKWHNAEKKTPALQKEHPRKGTFPVFVEDVSDDREILPDIVIFAMCKSLAPRASPITVPVAVDGSQGFKVSVCVSVCVCVCVCVSVCACVCMYAQIEN